MTESETEQSDDRGWVEMDSFHLIMTEAFHPYKDSANLEPARQLADEIASKAEYWASATLPDKVNTKEVKAMLTKLKEDTQALATMINKALRMRRSELHCRRYMKASMVLWKPGMEEPVKSTNNL